MRLGYVASSVSIRHALDSAPLDAEDLLSWSRTNELVVLVDEDGEGTDLLREAGISVHVSPARNTELPDGRWVSADGAQARLLAGLHQAQPLDAVVYGPGAYVDYGWFEPTLGLVPRLACLGGGIVGGLRLILDDPDLCQKRGRMVAAAAAFVASADALIGSADPADYGLLADDLPPVVALETVRPDSVSRVDDAPALIAVVASSEDRAGLATLVPRLLERVAVGPETVIAAIGPSVGIGCERTEDLVVAGCPAQLRHQLIVVPPGDDGVADNMLRCADVVIAARYADACIPAVRAAASTSPLLVLDQRRPPQPTTVLGGHTPTRDGGRRVLIDVEGPFSETTPLLESIDAADFAVLHTREGASEAARLLESPRLAGVDLVMLGQPDPMFGTPILEQLVPSVLVAHQSIWPALTRLMVRCRDLWELICACAGLSTLHRVRTLVLPAALETPTRPLPSGERLDLPFFVGGRRLLPRPNLVGSSDGTPPDGETPPSGTDFDLRSWVESHRWPERVRLALPTRFGLLHRAMQDHW